MGFFFFLLKQCREINGKFRIGKFHIVNDGGIMVLDEVTNCYSMSRLAQSVEHQTLNLRVVGSSPTLGDICFINGYEQKH